jgi:endonuclease YncB( thermonuclease family)
MDHDQLLLLLNNLKCEDNGKTIPLYIPDIQYGKVIKVYDGDTITIATPLHNGYLVPHIDVYKFTIRILGVDTAELKTKCPIEHQKAILVRDALSTMILQKVVTLTNISYDKYGRLLCNVYYNDINIAEWLLSQQYAVPYYGGKKNISM